MSYYTSIQKVRERAGLQNYRVDVSLYATGNSTIWSTNVQDLEKFVPRLMNGATVASVNDVSVTANGSAVGVSAININTGQATLDTGYASGASVLGTYATSPITGAQVLDYVAEAHSTVLSYVALEYDTPLGVSVPMLAELETKLAAGNILVNSYGVSSEDLAEDGYRMIEEANAVLQMIADGDRQLVDNTGKVVPKDLGVSGSSASSRSSQRVRGAIFTLDQEDFQVTPFADVDGINNRVSKYDDSI